MLNKGRLPVALLVAILLSTSAGTGLAQSNPWPANPDWQQYVEGPEAGDVYPVKIVSTSGDVDNPGAILNPGAAGATTMTRSPGGPNPKIVLDYGKDVSGVPFFIVTGSTGTPTLRAAYSEGRRYLGPKGDRAPGHDEADPSRCDIFSISQPGSTTKGSIQGGERFQEIALTSPGSLTLTGVGIHFSPLQANPDDYQGYFISSSDELNRIWYDGAYTAQLDQLPANSGQPAGDLIVDGAKRDRVVWGGDLSVAGPTVYYSTATDDYLRNSLLLLGTYQQANGEVGSDVPPSTPLGTFPANDSYDGYAYSTSYSIYYVVNLADYYLYTGDQAFVQQQWPIVQRELSFNAQSVDRDGLLVTNSSNGLDWHPYDGPLTGAVTEFNVLYYRALIEGSLMAKAIGQSDAEALYERRALAVKAAINANLFNSLTGVYDISSTRRGTLAQDANALAVLYGVAPADRILAILATLKSGLWTRNGPLAFSADSGFAAYISPFASDMELRARFQADDVEDALQLIYNLWGLMARRGPNFSGADWEALATDGTPGFGAFTSLAHGWSSGATSALSAFVLGIRPAAAGYQTWSVKPHPGNLAWVEGQTPTPYGPIVVNWGHDAKLQRFGMEVESPAGTTGTIGVPLFGGETDISVNGQLAWSHGRFRAVQGIAGANRDGNYVYLTGVSSGDYEIDSQGHG
jgi:hypothetical protein